MEGRRFHKNSNNDIVNGGCFWYRIWWGRENFGLQHLCQGAKIGPKAHKLQSVLVSDLVVMGILGLVLRLMHIRS